MQKIDIKKIAPLLTVGDFMYLVAYINELMPKDNQTKKALMKKIKSKK